MRKDHQYFRCQGDSARHSSAPPAARPGAAAQVERIHSGAQTGQLPLRRDKSGIALGFPARTLLRVLDQVILCWLLRHNMATCHPRPPAGGGRLPCRYSMRRAAGAGKSGWSVRAMTALPRLEQNIPALSQPRTCGASNSVLYSYRGPPGVSPVSLRIAGLVLPRQEANDA